MSVEDKLERLKRIKKKMERESLSSNYSDGLLRWNDYERLKEIFENLGVDFDYELYLHPRSYDYEKKYIDSNIDNNTDYLDFLETFTKMFNESGFVYYADPFRVKIPRNEIHEIIEDYLELLVPGLSKKYREMRSDSSILMHKTNDYCGITYPINTHPKEDTIFVDKDLRNNGLLLIETVIHEFFHKYSYDLSRTKGKACFEGLHHGHLCEVTTIYSEISFNNYLKKNHIYEKEAIFSFNEFFKLYFSSVYGYKYYLMGLEQDDANIDNPEYYPVLSYDYSNGYPVVEIDQCFIEEQNDIKIFDTAYMSSFSEADIRYTLGLLKAFEMFEVEKSGENMGKYINNFIASLYDLRQEEELLQNEDRIELVRKRVLENNNQINNYFKNKKGR